MLSGIVGGVFNAIMAFIFALYILLGKEKLKSQTARVWWRFCRANGRTACSFVANMASRTFAKFVSGQCTEACILGTLCWLGMSLLWLPYAPMIGALVGITALIPIVGAWVGLIVGAFMIGMESLTQALIFVIFLLVLQQVEGNPHLSPCGRSPQLGCRPSGCWPPSRWAAACGALRACCLRCRCAVSCTRCCAWACTAAWRRRLLPGPLCLRRRRRRKCD